VTVEERSVLEAGRRSADPFVRRRSQIVLASLDRAQVPAIARVLRCDEQTVRNAIHAFNQTRVAALQPGSRRAHHLPHAVFDQSRAERLRALLHRSPRTFGHPTSVWTLELAATVSFTEGLTPHRVSAETIRAALQRLGVRWQRAKQWITSPDPAYARKKGGATV
jgi:transposase